MVQRLPQELVDDIAVCAVQFDPVEAELDRRLQQAAILVQVRIAGAGPAILPRHARGRGRIEGDGDAQAAYDTMKITRGGKEHWAFVTAKDGGYKVYILARGAMAQDIGAVLARHVHFDLRADLARERRVQGEDPGIVCQMVPHLRDHGARQ